MKRWRVITKAGIALDWYGTSAGQVRDEANAAGHPVKRVELVCVLPSRDVALDTCKQLVVKGVAFSCEKVEDGWEFYVEAP